MFYWGLNSGFLLFRSGVFHSLPASKTVPEGPHLLVLTPCTVPSHTGPGVICVNERIWQKKLCITSKVRSWKTLWLLSSLLILVFFSLRPLILEELTGLPCHEQPCAGALLNTETLTLMLFNLVATRHTWLVCSWNVTSPNWMCYKYTKNDKLSQ